MTFTLGELSQVLGRLSPCSSGPHPPAQEMHCLQLVACFLHHLWASGNISNLSLLRSPQPCRQCFLEDLRKIQPCFLFCMTNISSAKIVVPLTCQWGCNFLVSAPLQEALAFYLLDGSDMVSNKIQGCILNSLVVSLKSSYQFSRKSKKVGEVLTV